jgi:hypothetical protein
LKRNNDEEGGTFMSEEQKVKAAKPKKVADAMAVSICPATQEMIKRAQELDIDTVFDRAVTMKPCNIGYQGTCCKICAMGPCRLPLPKAGIEGEDTRKGLCGATANTIAARNFARMVAAGTAAHSDHGRAVAEVFLSVARKETEDYTIKSPERLLQIAPHFGVATTVEEDGEVLDRNFDEIALEVAEKAVAEWGKPEGTLAYLKRAPAPLYERWKKLKAGGTAPQHRPRNCGDHAPHHHGCRSGLQEHRQAVHPVQPGRRLGRRHDRHRSSGCHVRRAVSAADRGQHGHHEGRPCQHHHSRP